MPAIEAESVDLLFCDPPYNLSVDYGVGGSADNRSVADYCRWSELWLDGAKRILAPTSSIWVLVCESWATHLSNFLSIRFPRCRNRIIWRERFGQYNESKFPSGHRHLFYHVKGPVFTWNPDAIRVPSERMRMGDKRAAGPRVPDDVWDVSRLQGNDRERMAGHPCQLRQWPLERIVLACTNPGDTVLDPMCGSGTMGAAAVLHGRHFIGIDQNPDYCEMAERRIANPEPELKVEDAKGQMMMFEECEKC